MAFNPFMPDSGAGDPSASPTPNPAPAPNASAPVPSESTSDSSTFTPNENLTPPTAAPAQAPLNLQPAQPRPEEPGEHFRNFSHALKGAVLGALAGPSKVVDGYDVDANGRTVPRVREMTGLERLRHVAQSALIGLAAGANTPPQKSRAASIAAGFGAGAAAQAQQRDLLQRQQAKEDFETQQKVLMDKAVRAAHNASTYSLWQKAMTEANDHDPERQKNLDLMNAANDFIARNPGTSMQVQIVTPDEAQSMREADNHSVGKHTFLPIGFKEAKDANGKPLFEADGVTQKQTGQIVMISGGTDDGKIPLPQSFVNDLQKFGKAAGIVAPEQYKQGTEISLPTVLAMDKAMNAVKSREIDGWKTAKDVLRQDGTHAQQNEVTGEVRSYPAGVQPNVENKPAGQAEELKLKKTEEIKNLATAEKDRSAAKNTSDKPVYAYNQQTKQLEQTTRGDVSAHPEIYSHPVDIKEGDIRKDQDLARQLGDAQMNISRYRAAVQRMDEPSYIQNGIGALGGSKRAMAALLAEDKFKLALWGSEIPVDFANQLLTSKNWAELSKEQQDAVVGYVGARGAVIAYQKAVSGSGRSNKEQLHLELQNIPTPLEPTNVREKKFERFQANIDQTGQGIPKMVGVDRPQEIRQRIEAEEAAKGGATHTYEPGSGQAIPVGATPVKNVFGKVIGYKDQHERVTLFPKQ